MPFPGRQCRNCIELLDTQLVSENCLVPWETLLPVSHTFELGGKLFLGFSYIGVYYIHINWGVGSLVFGFLGVQDISYIKTFEEK